MTHPDLDNLLNAALPLAESLLEKYGEFFPFGVSMDRNAGIDIRGEFQGDDRPLSANLIEQLKATLRTEASNGKIRASALCYDVKTIPPGETEKTDAIVVALERESGEAVDTYAPYRLLGGKVAWGQLFANSRKPEIFDGSRDK